MDQLPEQAAGTRAAHRAAAADRYLREANRPQPLSRQPRWRNGGDGWPAAPRPLFDFKFIASATTPFARAGAAILNAELMHSEGLL